MRVLCAHTGEQPHRAVLGALARYAPGTELVRVGGDEAPLGYAAAIAERWGSGPLVLVEHDIEVHADVLPSFAACPEPWCLFRYQHMTLDNWIDTGLGCVRFSAECQRLVPWEAVLAQDAPVPGSWRHLDGQVAAAMAEAGVERHVHEPPVTHWNRHLRS